MRTRFTFTVIALLFVISCRSDEMTRHQKIVYEINDFFARMQMGYSRVDVSQVRSVNREWYLKSFNEDTRWDASHRAKVDELLGQITQHSDFRGLLLSNMTRPGSKTKMAVLLVEVPESLSERLGADVFVYDSHADHSEADGDGGPGGDEGGKPGGDDGENPGGDDGGKSGDKTCKDWECSYDKGRRRWFCNKEVINSPACGDLVLCETDEECKEKARGGGDVAEVVDMYDW